MTDRPRVLLDCDPGVDDMFAMFTALRYTELVGVVSVAGNVGIEYTTRNALSVLELANAAIPVFRGAVGPINGATSEDASHVHGTAGLGGVELAAPSTDVAGTDPVAALLDLTSDEQTNVVAIGPLTNIALALQHDPTWAQRVPRLVVMGGSTGAGNARAYAEYNIWADPEAAALVFASKLPITMVGLNLTRQVTMGPREIELLRAAGTSTSVVAANALDFYSDFGLQSYGVKESAMHDPCAVLEVVEPTLFGGERMHVEVEVNGEHTRGMTVCDQRQNATAGDTRVLLSADRQATVDLIVEAAIAPNASPPE